MIPISLAKGGGEGGAGELALQQWHLVGLVADVQRPMLCSRAVGVR